jgi:uncharacterized protein (DUF58 family)
MTFTKLLTIYSASAAITLVAWVLNVSQLYWMAGVLFLLPLGSMAFARLERWGLGIERHIVQAAHQGETVPVRLTAHNERPLPKLNLSLQDLCPDGIEPLEPGPIPVHLPPGGTDTVEYLVRLRRRGAHVFRGLCVHSTDLMGLYDQRLRIGLETHVLVYPRIAELPPRVMVKELSGGSAPLETSSRKGEGSSFFGIREYLPGDPLKHVHWRTTARRGSLAVVEWEAEESRSALLAVETLRGSDRDLSGGTTLDAAAGLAASLAADVLRTGNSVRVLAPGTTDWRTAAERGTEAMPKLLEILARMQATSDLALPAELRRVASYAEPGSVVCWLTPIADPDLVSTVRYLRSIRLRPIIYALIAADVGQVCDWDPIARELEGMGVSVVRLYRDDELIRHLLG